MIFHKNCLPADNSHEISCLICYFWKSAKIWNCRLLQIIGCALWAKYVKPLVVYLFYYMTFYHFQTQRHVIKQFLAHQIRISVVFTHVRSFYLYLTYLYQPVRKIKTNSCMSAPHSLVTYRSVTSMSHLSVIKDLLEVFSCFSNIKWGVQWWARKRIQNSCEDVLEKSVPPDHHLSSFGKPRDANRWSLGQIFLSHPHTHDGFL